MMIKCGRRTLYLWGHFVTLMCLVLIGCVSFAKSSSSKWVTVATIFIWNGSFDALLGPAMHCMVTEAPSTRLRSKTVAIALWSQSIVSTVGGVLNPYMINPTAWNWKVGPTQMVRPLADMFRRARRPSSGSRSPPSHGSGDTSTCPNSKIGRTGRSTFCTNARRQLESSRPPRSKRKSRVTMMGQLPPPRSCRQMMIWAHAAFVAESLGCAGKTPCISDCSPILAVLADFWFFSWDDVGITASSHPPTPQPSGISPCQTNPRSLYGLGFIHFPKDRKCDPKSQAEMGWASN